VDKSKWLDSGNQFWVPEEKSSLNTWETNSPKKSMIVESIYSSIQSGPNKGVYNGSITVDIQSSKLISESVHG